MTTLTTYGLGGYCENCNPAHSHTLDNIEGTIETIDMVESVPLETKFRKSALAKLAALGLTQEEIESL